ncbi:phosphate acyltransferase PlsX [Liberiplasma polymorphum]|uniref:phosphate acyltransferase PlsX n=1 Tax=Liberiplasma polymorphum TaxID=3374570 RepID=UPI003776549A
MIKIAVDAMGGDFAPKEQIEGAMLAIKKIPDIEITLYGDIDKIKPYLKDDTRITLVQTDGVIDMGEKDPIRAIRSNRKSSMAQALTSVRNKENAAVVSSGATQALIAGAHILVGRMKNMKRTAIAPLIPNIRGTNTILLDSGGNIEIKPEFMLQQAYFATIYAKEVMGIEDPKVGLINIGSEEGKGRELDKEVYELFKTNKHINFYGNVEPKDVLNPPCEILISDGFTANIVMKTIEGTARGVGAILKEELKRGFFGKLGLILSMNNLKRFKKRLAPEEIGGAMIYGLNGVVVKAQGSSKAVGFYNGIRQAALVVRQDVINKVSKVIDEEENE